MDPLLLTPTASSMFGTFYQSIRSVGTAVTLASVGAYLHQRGFVAGEGKRTLALISQQVTFPLFLFTKIIYCNQNWSSEPCPDVTQSLSSGWILLIWPLYVVGCGFLVGWAGAKLSGTPKDQVRSVLAAVGFANSTGLPITLLTVVHTNFPETSDLGHIDPTLFLSVYLLLYPVLQWGIGGWLLTPAEELSSTEEEEEEEEDEHLLDAIEQEKQGVNRGLLERGGSGGVARRRSSHDGGTHAFTNQKKGFSPVAKSLGKNVLNNKSKELWYKHSRRGMKETDASLYISESDLYQMAQRFDLQQSIPQSLMSPGGTTPITPGAQSLPPPETNHPNGGFSPYEPSSYQQPNHHHHHHNAMAAAAGVENDNFTSAEQLKLPFLPGTPPQGQPQPPPPPPPQEQQQQAGTTETSSLLLKSSFSSEQQQQQQQQQQLFDLNSNQFQVDSILSTLEKVCSRCLQPPVIGAIAGICVAVTPLRGIFVDIEHRSSHAPLQWCFDGLYNVGTTAVPINMMILGCNLSASYNARKKAKESGITTTPNNMLSMQTMIAIVISKMIVLPIVGIASALFLKSFVLNIDEEIDGAFYLVMMIVFLTPTANNVMVMVELSGSNTKEGIANVIAMQYIVAPVLLSLTLSLAIGFASGWS